MRSASTNPIFPKINQKRNCCEQIVHINVEVVIVIGEIMPDIVLLLVLVQVFIVVVVQQYQFCVSKKANYKYNLAGTKQDFESIFNWLILVFVLYVYFVQRNIP